MQQTQKQQTKSETETAEEEAPEPQDVQNPELDADVDDILKDIDDILEAQFDFALQFVQQGGQ